MTKPLLHDRLRELRARKRLTQEGLAKKSRVSKAQIYRLEKPDRRPAQVRTLENLAKALDVEPGVLTGDLPMPEAPKPPQRDPEPSESQMNIRIDGAARNALMLVASRYRISNAQIVELAPLLFVLAAEGSLKRRQERLAELNAHAVSRETLRPGFPYLPNFVGLMSGREEEALAAERESIAARDILASRLPDHIWGGADVMEGEDFDEGVHNPFVLYLQEVAATYSGAATINRFGHYSMNYSVCRDEALELAGGDAAIADAIVDGWILLADIPRDLRARDAIDRRRAWLRKRLDEVEENIPEITDLEVLLPLQKDVP